MGKALLQGKAIRHPLHPLLVHFPIGFFGLSFVLDGLSLVVPPEEKLAAGAFYSMAAGLLFAVGAAVPGLVDYMDIRDDHPSKKIATYHMGLNLVMVGVYGCNLGLRFGEWDPGTTRWIPFLLSCAGIGILSISGYLGGMMVYGDGIGVGRHRRKTATPQKTIHAIKSSSEPEESPVPVAESSGLKEGETLRVSIRGTIVTVAKVDGRIYAIQEFCTHRHGPLSEGCLKKGEIECPWHRSRFDVRTGKVLAGPAAMDLKTFPVEEREGKIWVSTKATA